MGFRANYSSSLEILSLTYIYWKQACECLANILKKNKTKHNPKQGKKNQIATIKKIKNKKQINK